MGFPINCTVNILPEEVSTVTFLLTCFFFFSVLDAGLNGPELTDSNVKEETGYFVKYSLYAGNEPRRGLHAASQANESSSLVQREGRVGRKNLLPLHEVSPQ